MKDSMPFYTIKKLYEKSYKELYKIFDKKRIERSKKCKARYVGVLKDGTIRFEVNSATIKGKYYNVDIKLKDLDEAKKLIIDNKPLNTTQVLQLALSGDIEVYCTCPDFKYRFAYIAFNNKYGFFKETRFPKIRNPQMQGCACKHTYSALKVMPMYFANIQSDMIKRKILMNPKQKIKTLK